MKTKLLRLATIILAFFCIGSALTFSFQPAFATDDVCNSSAPAEVKEANGCSGSSDRLPGVVVFILNAIIGISGLVAVVFVVIGGVSYMTSSGESAKVEKAKKTIISAVIGMIICVLAFAIVNWAIGAITGGATAADPAQYKTEEECRGKNFKWENQTCTK
ncbi:MAG: pilin [Candidatus Saccharibacteria bacterium]|nr:pilin [Candidatus Saccharibacteria bacterium]